VRHGRLGSRRSPARLAFWRMFENDLMAQFDIAGAARAAQIEIAIAATGSLRLAGDLVFHLEWRARLSGPQPHSPRPVLCATAIAANLQADPDDFGAWTAISRSCAASATKICAPTGQPEFTQLDLEMSFPRPAGYFRKSLNGDAARARPHRCQSVTAFPTDRL